MRNYLLLSLISLTLAVTAGCSEGKKCDIEGHTSFTQYQCARLTTLNGVTVDSVEIKEGKFCFHQTDTIPYPYGMLVRLCQTSEPYDWIEMPVFIEDGTVTMDISPSIHISGTPLNNTLQSFFDQLQQMKDAVRSHKELTEEEMATAFSEFYRRQILANKNNALGRYIYESYGIHLTDQDKKQVEAAISF